MAVTAITPDKVYRESMGSTTLIMATFAAISTGQWTHGLPNVVAYWCAMESNTTMGICTSGSTIIQVTMNGATPGIIYALTKT